MKKKILYLDDDRFYMGAYYDALIAADYEVEWFLEPADAIDDIKSGNQYDLMIIDLLMRVGVDELPEEAERAGLRFVKEIRETYSYKGPILFVTVLDDDELYKEARQYGKVLRKPVGIESFLRFVGVELK